MKKENSRRKFITNTALAMTTTGLVASGCSTDKEGMAGKFIHHVFFWLKVPVTDDVRARFESALRELVTIGVIIDYHLGRPADTNREVIDSSYTYSLLTTFKNKADQDTYQTHPKHLRFIEDCNGLWDRVVVYDSENI